METLDRRSILRYKLCLLLRSNEQDMSMRSAFKYRLFELRVGAISRACSVKNDFSLFHPGLVTRVSSIIDIQTVHFIEADGKIKPVFFETVTDLLRKIPAAGMVC